MSGPSGLRSGVGQALAVLEEVARAGPSLSANGIARILGMPRASAYRLINALVSEEYLLRHPTLDGFLLGVRVVELAHLVAPTQPVVAPDIIGQLRMQTGEAVHFVRYQRGRVVVVDEDPMRPLLSVNRTRRQLGSTAIGRLLLAGFAPPLTAHPDREAVAEVISTARSSGITAAEHRRIAAEVTEHDFAAYAEPDGQGRACIAVPVRSGDGRLVGGVALSTADGDLDAAARHLSRVRDSAALLVLAAQDAGRGGSGDLAQGMSSVN
ncbi:MULTISPECIES: helix-turn-helix domain-containing protein [unclassified Microbacterium]|uniref:IclR family transcriptional regulator n=1 Tax=unclassified Microbacterium TaxID=2609290 RepID=UPI00214B45F2|nr:MULTISPECIES: helix-turn-helix domain-containing protein [unclassified Microbacterium]MCR2784984.1 helix-turn-helix domain-containing protein [Microbacterium sp. zg.B96]MDL5352351.1 helix-turn-helix domain-containing protein [Microbacterium sp. zg-YB36]WIM16523.1 helix-turn-helix domain-containing protein [Microbacterium sp. zg-B96]